MAKATTKIVPPGLVGLMHVGAVCELIGCTPRTLKNYQIDRQHPFPQRKKFGRCSYYSEAAVRRWLAERLGDLAA
ncbi:hypothetical protein RLW55_03245 [Hyphomicrobium sp. B1]|uniref:helix-turn-helix transcriptional regulator n=1 Tax=Hyphomicrobium sp. B1 TaxID=3075651 RepID=UPI003C2FA15D